LHIHDEFSFLDGLGSARDYAATAKELGFSYLALTNHGNVDGNIKFQRACQSEGITPIFGVEFYIVDNIEIKEKGEKRYHLVALAKNQLGIKNIFKMLTIANLEGFYYRPRIDKRILLNHIEGLIILSACTSSFLLDGDGNFLKELHAVAGEDLYLEIMPHDYAPQKELNQLCLELSDKYRIKLVATNDCHYVLEKGTELQEVLLAIQTKKKWKDPNRWKFDVKGLYLRTADEMMEAFRVQDVVPEEIYIKALRETRKIANKCKESILLEKRVDLPKVPGYEDRDETELLRELVEIGFGKRLKDASNLGEYRDRLEEEFGLICNLGFQRYFLIVWELIFWCKKNDIMVGPGRGSVGSSLLAYLLYITDVDPIKYNLIFARFISPARIDLPDIDMDFEDIKRPLVRKHLEDCYGKDNVCGVSTFLTMKGRAALRDVSRVFDLPIVDVDKAAKSIVTRSGGDFRANFCIEDAFSTFEDGIEFKRKYPKVTSLSVDLEGQARGAGCHAAAICISSESLKEGERCNIIKRKDVELCNWDKYDCEFAGLMKLDVLGLSALTILNRTKYLVQQNYGIEILFDEIPLDDIETLKMINSGYTVGAFQIGSLGLQEFCKELGIKEFKDIVHATALWRPGTLRAGWATEFVLRKMKEKPVEYIHPALEGITKDTQGIILYQEQVMKLMYDLGGLPWKTCDTVRKVISKSQGDELFKKFKGLFVEGCGEKETLSKEEAGIVWDGLSSFGSYSFSCVHAVEYSLITYWGMFLKTYYPKEFLCASLTYGNRDRKLELIEEAKRLELEIELPRIGFSHPTEWLPSKEENKMFTPFIEIKGVGEKTAQQLAKLEGEHDRKGFWKPEGRTINKAVRKKLGHIGALDDVDFSKLDLELVSSYFDFDLSRDPMGKYRGIFNLLDFKKVLSTISSLDFKKTETESQLFFGKMAEVKFGYRKNVLKTSGLGEVAVPATSLGGVYGFFKDDTAPAMLIFESEIYAKNKSEVEHCSDKWMLIKANHPRRAANLFCNDAWIGDKLLKGELEGLDADLSSRISYKNREVVKCIDSACGLRAECSSPVSNSPGKCNIMITGEAPGREEDRIQQGFVGKAGSEILWPELNEYKLNRNLFHITNIVKCFPSETKTPTKKQINRCGELWLSKEIEKVEPILILAFGNTSVKFFKGQDSGIVSLNGTTEWDNKVEAWICWCIHPASVLYHRENMELFSKGIKNFVDKIGILTDITKKL
jgi:DNA polymerase-3 subunit alpha